MYTYMNFYRKKTKNLNNIEAAKRCYNYQLVRYRYS